MQNFRLILILFILQYSPKKEKINGFSLRLLFLISLLVILVVTKPWLMFWQWWRPKSFLLGLLLIWHKWLDLLQLIWFKIVRKESVWQNFIQIIIYILPTINVKMRIISDNRIVLQRFQIFYVTILNLWTQLFTIHLEHHCNKLNYIFNTN